MTQFLVDVGLVVQSCIGWMEDYLDAILASPALFTICIAVPLVSISVNLLNRLIRL